MTQLSKLLIASVLALSCASPVLAQTSTQPEGSTLLERNLYYFTADGRMVHMKASDASHAMIMKEFKPMAGTMIYVSGKKLYMAQDSKMSNGKMMSMELFGRDPAGIPQ